MMFFKPTSVNIGFMKINNTDQLSSISFGSTFKFNRNVSAKKTQGFGQQHADLTLQFDTVQMVLDEDVLDNPAIKNNRLSTIL